MVMFRHLALASEGTLSDIATFLTDPFLLKSLSQVIQKVLRRAYGNMETVGEMSKYCLLNLLIASVESGFKPYQS